MAIGDNMKTGRPARDSQMKDLQKLQGTPKGPGGNYEGDTKPDTPSGKRDTASLED